MAERKPVIYVLAGTNGAGKSSVGGETFRARGTEHYNPDEAARAILSADPGASQQEANSAAWRQGVRLLQQAVEKRFDFAFETTLGGESITAHLERAIAEGCGVRVWYVALSSPELHIERVKRRVAKGGHDIPETAIRSRYDTSRENLIRLLGGLDELRVYDNSDEGDPKAGVNPNPRLLLHVRRRVIEFVIEPEQTPAWAKPIIAAVLRLRRR